MGQYEVITFLKKQKQPLSRREIAEKMKECETKISAILRKLCDYNEVKSIEINRLEAMIKYNSKRRLKVFYV